MKVKIKLNNVSDVEDFVNIANHCSFDIDVQYHHFILDGKSLVALMSIDLSNELTIYSRETNPVFETMLKKYEV